MGKRIIQQRRGKGGLVYRVRNKAGLVRPGYPADLQGTFKLVNLISSPGHSTPLAKFVNKTGKVFHNFAANLIFIGKEISVGGESDGDIAILGNLKNGTKVFNIENQPMDGGKLIRAGGLFGMVLNHDKGRVTILMPSKKEKKFDKNCRATIGIAAGDGRVEKPILKAGKNFHIKKAKSKLWPITSAVKMNKIDHPFGSGRGKRVKSKIAKRNASPGKKVGHLRPRRTGRKKR